MNKKEAIANLENLLELNKAQGHLSPSDTIAFSESIAALKNGKKKKDPETESEAETDAE